MAQIRIVVSGHLAWVCGSCGCSGTTPLSVGAPACCENRALFARAHGVVSSYLDGRHDVAYSEQWYDCVTQTEEAVRVTASVKGVANMASYVDAFLHAVPNNPRGIRAIVGV